MRTQRPSPWNQSAELNWPFGRAVPEEGRTLRPSSRLKEGMPSGTLRLVQPEVRYAKGDEGYVAYAVIGQGPPDILFIPNWATNLETMWEEPSLVRYFDRLSGFGRVICYDKRGSGLSDPVPLASLPTLEQWMDDARLAMDASAAERAALIGDTEGGPTAILFAATYPERTSALVLINSFARWKRAVDYPVGMPEPTFQKLIQAYEAEYGTGSFLDLTAPSIAEDPRMRRWQGRLERLAMPPGAAATMFRWILQADVRSVLPLIRVPTLIIHRKENQHHRVAHGRYLAQAIPGAKYVELPGADSYPFHAGDLDAVLDEVEEFLTGRRDVAAHDRVLATVMFTDIVGSTELAAELGDVGWLDLRRAHDALVRQLLQRFRGNEIQTIGDGFVATFDGPARAVRCAVEIARAVRTLGLEVRIGLHTGEVELLDGGLGGIAVHLAQRVMTTALPGQVIVSSTVRDLVVGSGIQFGDRGSRVLKGVPGEWRLFEVERLPQAGALAGSGRVT
jgi:class 3 adenylate cyclase